MAQVETKDYIALLHLMLRDLAAGQHEARQLCSLYLDDLDPARAKKYQELLAADRPQLRLAQG